MRIITFLTFLILFSLSAYAEPPRVRVSILSLLQPRELKLTLLSPASGMLRNSAREVPILAGKTLKLSTKNGLPGEHLSLNCAEACNVRIQIDKKMDRSYSGQFEFYYTNNNTIQIVLLTSREELIASVAASEMRESREHEAIEAFAIVSRSFLIENGRHPEMHADFCDTTHCQVFQNLQAAPEIKTAVQRSESLVLTFHNRPFRPYYSRSCGGRTATFQDAWGKESQPYEFSAVSCPCVEKPLRWQASLSSEELAAITGLQNAKLVREENTIDVSAGNTGMQFPLEVFRTKLGQAYGWNKLPGNNYAIAQTSHGFVMNGVGKGHGVGFCQIGAEILASKGLSFTEILSHYFPQTEVKNQPPRRQSAKKSF